MLEIIAQYSQIIGAIIFVVVIVWMFRKFVLPALATTKMRRTPRSPKPKRGARR